MDFYDGNAWRGYQAVTCTVGSWVWYNRTFAGLSMDQTDVDNARIRFRANVAGTKQIIMIATVYAVVTYTEPPPPEGYSSGNPLGIPYTKVGSVMGIPISKIGKVKGV